VHGSGIAHRALQGAYETGRPLEAVGNGAEPDTSGAVLALIVVDLARAWTKQKRKRGPDAPERRSAPTDDQGEHMEAVELSQQQSARMAELPEDYRVVGVDHSAPLGRKPTGQIIHIQQNGRLSVATTAARPRPVAASSISN
jgi:hypothetical protein